MSIPEPLNPEPLNPEPLNPSNPSAGRFARRLAQNFTPDTPLHHPLLDPDVPKDDFGMVPPRLFAGRRKLNWALPKPAKANLHVMLKLTNNPDEFVKEFQEKIPQINEVLGLWSEVKGTRPTTTAEAQLRVRAPIGASRDGTSTKSSKGSAFNLVSALDTPARTEVIYLADATEESGECAKGSIPSNLRAIDWFGFDVHLDGAEPEQIAFPTGQGPDFHEYRLRRNSTRSNLRTATRLDDGYGTDLSGDTYNQETDSDAETLSNDM